MELISIEADIVEGLEETGIDVLAGEVDCLGPRGNGQRLCRWP